MKTLKARTYACMVYFAAALLTSHAHALTSPPPDEILTVSQGQSLLLGYAGVTRVAVGDGELLEVRVLKENDEILLIALKPGVTDLRLWTQGDEPKRYLVQVNGDEADRSQAGCYLCRNGSLIFCPLGPHLGNKADFCSQSLN